MPEAIKRRTPITIGADPEVFCFDKTKKMFVSAHDKIPGTKFQPFPVSSGAIQVDGVAAEFNITPAVNSSDFLGKCQIVMNELKTRLGDNIDMVFSPTATFDPVYWNTLPGITKELGCNPDFNAWTGTVNPSPDGSLGTMRTASGHIHIGWGKNFDPNDPDHFEDCRILVRQLDFYLGAPSILWDADTKRRTLYGKAGAFRPKPYGLEYRTLSNKWLTSGELTKFVFTQAYNCVNGLLSGSREFTQKYNEAAREVIDGGIRWWEDRNHTMYKMYSNEIGEIPVRYLDKEYKKEEKAEKIEKVDKELKIRKKTPTTSLTVADWGSYVSPTPPIGMSAAMLDEILALNPISSF